MAKRLLWIGMDGASLGFIDKFVAEGKLPTFKRLMERGVCSISHPIPPCDTPTNWSSLQTGAHTGTTEVVSFFTHVPGEPLNVAHSNTHSGAVKAELFWEAAERQGKKCIVLNWPCSWPSRLKEGWQVDGTGPYTPSWRISYGQIFLQGQFERRTLDPAIVKKTGGMAAPLSLAPAEGWTNLPPSHQPPLAASFSLVDGKAGEEKGQYTYHLLVVDSAGQGYDRVLVAHVPDAARAICSLGVGQWSDWLTDRFTRERVLDRTYAEHGPEVEGVFRCKLLALAPDASRIALYRTDIWTGDGWARPAELCAELRQAVGPFTEGSELPPATARVLDDWQTYKEQLAWTREWYVQAARYLTQKEPWDVLAIQWHTQDGINHVLARDIMEDEAEYQPAKAAKAWPAFEACYVACDQLVAGLLEAAADDETIVCVVSDHGALPTFRTCYVNVPLVRAGLLNYNFDAAKGKWVVDWSRTKAFPRRGQLWLNLKGRDPEGIVEPLEYAKVQEQVIQALLGMRDPENGASCMAAALRKEEASFLGQWGNAVGDVPYFMAPRYADSELDYYAVEFDPYTKPDAGPTDIGCAHHLYLPSAEHGIWKVAAVFFLAGPGVKQAYRRPHPITQADVAPTLAHLLGIEPPSQCEGMIVADALA
ncbi:MAG: alkaline phosphatase family protein [Chloroflexi bacterium]|nr:alkaline phosphatase family protein [Chloroflexota bacterium]